MKKIFLLSLLGLLVIFSSTATFAYSEAKSTIAVLSASDFLPDRTGTHKDVVVLPEVLAARIIEYLTNSKRFVPVERQALRKVVMENRFGQELQKSYLDKTLDKAIESMDSVYGNQGVKGTETEISAGQIGVKKTNAAEPNPVGQGIHEGQGSIGTTGVLADYNDILKDFQDLGGAVGADFLVLGNVEKLQQQVKTTDIPYSTKGRQFKQKIVDARLRLRVISSKTGTVSGASSFRTRVTEDVFKGKEISTDQFSFYDHLGRLAAIKILDMTFPARIVSTKPLLVSRGSNDGVTKGDIFQIEHEGKEIKDQDGVVIARLKNEVGLVKISRLQETIAFVKPLSGSGFSNGDLATLEIQAEESTSPEPATAPSFKQTADPPVSKPTLPRVALGLVKSKSTARTGAKAAEHTPIFTDTIISRLTQTKRFQMIDRQEVDQLLNEQQAQALAEGRDMPSAMGNLKGADYLVYGSLAAFSVKDKTVKLPKSKRVFKTKIGHVEGNMRIVNARSGDILESRKISVEERLDPDVKGSLLATHLADAYAEQVVLMLMNAVYPIKVAAVGADGTVYINRGHDGGLSQGEVLKAYSPGKPVIDPDTGVQLGVEEIYIGDVIIDSVADARSKGRLVVGSDLSRGDILKRSLKNKDKRSAESQEPKPSQTGSKLSSGQASTIQELSPGKPTLAIGRIKLNPGAKTSGFGSTHLTRMTNELLTKLTNTNRFQLMERYEIDQILDEKAFDAINQGGDIRDYLEELQGADYLIHGEISNFYTTSEQIEVSYLDETETHVTGVADGTFRIVDVHQGKVIAADQIEIRRRIKESDSTLVISDMMDRFSTQAVKKIVVRIYPIKLLGMSNDGTIYLNRGADVGLQTGTVFDVMRPGQELRDPDTGLSFGQAESKIGRVEIMAVEQNRARARMVSGHTSPQTGDILRKSQEFSKQEERQKTDQPTW